MLFSNSQIRELLGWSTFRGLAVSVLLPTFLTGLLRVYHHFTQNKIQLRGKKALKLQGGYS